MKKIVKRNANPEKQIQSYHSIFLTFKTENTTMLSDIHGIKKQKRTLDYSLCTNSLTVGSFT